MVGTAKFIISFFSKVAVSVKMVAVSVRIVLFSIFPVKRKCFQLHLRYVVAPAKFLDNNVNRAVPV